MKAGRTKVSVFEVSPHVLWDHVAAYLIQFEQVLSYSSFDQNERWRFVTMLDRNDFVSLCNCLDVEGHKMPNIMTTYWKCGETSHTY